MEGIKLIKDTEIKHRKVNDPKDKDLLQDNKGQWILLSGLAISISLVAVAVLLNQAAVSGYHSSSAALEFPKDDIRDLVFHSREMSDQAVSIAVALNNSSNQSIGITTRSLINNYSDQVSTIYAYHGQTVDVKMDNLTISANNTTSTIDSIWLNITFNDGNTFYYAAPEIVEVDI